MKKEKLSDICFIKDGKLIIQDDKNQEKIIFNSSELYALLLLITNLIFENENLFLKNNKNKMLFTKPNFMALIIGAVVGIIAYKLLIH